MRPSLLGLLQTAVAFSVGAVLRELDKLRIPSGPRSANAAGRVAGCRFPQSNDEGTRESPAALKPALTITFRWKYSSAQLCVTQEKLYSQF